MVEDISNHYSKDNLVIVSPDVGGVVRSRALAKYLDGLELFDEKLLKKYFTILSSKE